MAQLPNPDPIREREGRIVLYGPGGFGLDVLTALRSETRPIVFAADHARPPVLGIPVIAPDRIAPDDAVCVSITDPRDRRAVVERLGPRRYHSAIADTAVVGRDVEIGEGAAFCHFTIVTPRVRIGRHFSCNVYAYVGHDSFIGDFVTLGPRVGCNGAVHIGDGAFVGAGAVIRNGRRDRPLTIGAGAFVCMGSVVVADVPSHAKVFGNPARIVGPAPGS